MEYTDEMWQLYNFTLASLLRTYYVASEMANHVYNELKG